MPYERKTHTLTTNNLRSGSVCYLHGDKRRQDCPARDCAGRHYRRLEYWGFCLDVAGEIAKANLTQADIIVYQKNEEIPGQVAEGKALHDKYGLQYAF